MFGQSFRASTFYVSLYEFTKIFQLFRFRRLGRQFCIIGSICDLLSRQIL